MKTKETHANKGKQWKTQENTTNTKTLGGTTQTKQNSKITKH